MSEFIETTGGSVIGSAVTLLTGVLGTSPCPFINGPSPRHQETRRCGSIRMVHSTFASTVQTCAHGHEVSPA